jgi:nicotinamidase/pyrazinamidase
VNGSEKLDPGPGDALLVIDVQRDFLAGGALPVPGGEEVIPVLNRYIERFLAASRPVFATRDWHPADHCSFRSQGGPWPEHCIARSRGASFADGLRLPAGAYIISKAESASREAYSGFQGTRLASSLRDVAVKRVFIGGLATDYCVLETALGALAEGFEAVILEDAIRAVNLRPDDGAQALELMQQRGARLASLDAVGHD